MTAYFPNGLGASLGDQVVVGKPMRISGNVWYVDDSGTDAASPVGKNRWAPLATLAQAVTNAAGGDVIVLMDGHAETISGTLTITKNLTIVGEGQSDGKPTVKLTNGTGEGNSMISTTGASPGDYLSLRNIWFEECTQSNTDPRILATSDLTLFEMRGCYLEGGANDQGAMLSVSSAVTSIVDTVFISTSTTTDKPELAITGTSTNIVLMLDGVTIDGGTVGWADPWAVDLSNGDTMIVLAESVSLLRGSDVNWPSGGDLGYWNTQTSTGGVREG